jgi:hypothetical protein
MSRYETIDDGSEDDKADISALIGEHMIPIRVWTSDPKPKRLVFAIIEIEGRLEIGIYLIDKEFRRFTPSAEHDEVSRSNFAYYPVDHQTWIKKNITLNRKISTAHMANIRQYIFEQMRKTPNASEHINACTDEQNARINNLS